MPKPARVVQDYNSIRNDLLAKGALFSDKHFPPSSSSLFFDGRIPPGNPFGYNIVWKRPGELVTNPQFVVGGLSHHDIDQGSLGNCWFLAGAACLASTQKELFQKVVPLDQGFEKGKYMGMFRFNFWWYGDWIEIVVDDYLPTNGQTLIYSLNRDRLNEFWPCLLEKAYAKLRGCYEALVGGKIQDALVDMTGGISEVIKIAQKNDIRPELYSLLLTSFKMKSLIGASIFRPANSTATETKLPNGLFMGHAYSVTGCQQISTARGTVNLLRLRNPWGQMEWTGAWSDISPEMSQLPPDLQKQLSYENKDEGEFWISYEDFINNFDEIQLCHLQPDALIAELADNESKQLWNVTVYHDAWIRGVSAGGCGNSPNKYLYWKNPQFYVSLETPDVTLGHGDDCTLIVSLMEKEKDKKSKVSVGFAVYQLMSPDLRPLDNSRAPQNALLRTRRSGKYIFYREVTKRFELKPGTYVIIPSTFLPHVEAEFMMRLFSEKKPASGVLMEKAEVMHSTPMNKNLVLEAFEKHAGADKRLDASELKPFLEDLFTSEFGDPLEFPVETCRSLITLLDEDKSGFLGLNEAKEAWQQIKLQRDILKQSDVDGSNSVDTYELGTMFPKLGLPVGRNILTSIVRRYGGRKNQIGFPELVMIACKLSSFFDSFAEQQKKKDKETAEFTLNEFLEVTMYI